MNSGLVAIQTLIPVVGETPIWSALEAFLASRDSINTRRAFRRHLTQAFRAMRIETLEDFTPAHLVAFRAALLGDGRGPASHAQALAAVRSFLTWCADMGGLELAPRKIRLMLPQPRGKQKKSVVILNDGEVQRVLAAASTPRDRALALVLLGAGLRAEEVVKLDLGDLHEDVEGGMILEVHGKGAKDRLVPVTEEVLEALRAYVAATGRCMEDAGPIFLAEDSGASRRPSGRLAVRRVGKIVEGWKDAAGLKDRKKISPHTFRRTFAVNFLRKNGDVAELSDLLGHSNVNTTMIYVRFLQAPKIRRKMPVYTDPQPQRKTEAQATE